MSRVFLTLEMAIKPTGPVFPPLTRQAVLNCSFSSWYPLFRRHSLKATVLRPLPADFRAYLESDGIFAPVGSADVSSMMFA